MKENKFFEDKAKGLLHQTRILLEKQDEFKRKTGESFNIFSILNMERLEVRTHSAFIYELLNPKGVHFQGDLFLRVFIEEILELDDFNFKNIIVERERSTDFGRLDLVIENDDTLLIIEIKVDAGDQDKQLIRYDNYAKNRGKDYSIYYLTLFGDNASDNSAVEGTETVGYHCLSFKEDIYKWINICLRKGNIPLLPLIRENLCQYNRVIEKITNKVDRGVTKEMKDILLRDNNLEVLEKLNEAIPYAKAELEFKFWRGLYEKYNNKIETLLGASFIDNGEFSCDEAETIESIMEYRKIKSDDYYIEYLVGEYKNNRVRMVIGNSGYDPNVYVSIGLQDRGENNISYKEYDKDLIKVFNSLGFDKSGVYKYKYLNYDLNFHSKIYKLTNENIMSEAVTSIGDEVLEIVKGVSGSVELKELLD